VIEEYASTTDCRSVFIRRYFGEADPPRCGLCDRDRIARARQPGPSVLGPRLPGPRLPGPRLPGPRPPGSRPPGPRPAGPRPPGSAPVGEDRAEEQGRPVHGRRRRRHRRRRGHESAPPRLGPRPGTENPVDVPPRVGEEGSQDRHDLPRDRPGDERTGVVTRPADGPERDEG
jgi:hypothetical protein